MNHKARLIDWPKLGAVINQLQEQGRWRDLLCVACATFTGCRPADWTQFTWGVFLKEDGSVRDEISIIERKPENIAKAKRKKSGKPVAKVKPRQIFILPRFKEILLLCYEHANHPYLNVSMFRGRSRGVKLDGVTPNTANTWLARIGAEFGLSGDITSYSFRKSGARRIYDSQDNPVLGIRLAQGFLNHKSSNSTMHYIGLADDEMRSAFSQLNF